MIELITAAEYARRRGVSRAAVAKAIKTGRIRLFDGMIDPDVADVQWRRNTNPTQLIRKALAQAQAPGASGPAPAAAAPPRLERDDGYIEGRRREQIARAALAELELAEKSGRLIDVEQLRPMYAQMVGAFKTEMLALPAKLKAELDTLHAIEVDLEVLERPILTALEQLSRYDPCPTSTD
jgi:hypothetical protein